MREVVIRHGGNTQGASVPSPGTGGQTLRVRFGTPPHHLSQVGNPKQDQLEESGQEYSPRYIGHVVAKPC